MSFPTTDRIKRWYEAHEIHFAVAKAGGEVKIGIAPNAVFAADDVLKLLVPAAVWTTVKDYLAVNPWIALHPGGLGAVKAPYQLKGIVRPLIVDEDGDTRELVIDLRELYITKPGPEAGQRVDQWSKEKLTEFERSLGWLEGEAF